MGKASRRRRAADGPDGGARTRAEPVPYAARPFQGLTHETEWVAIREILPAATATVALAGPPAARDLPAEAQVVTVLPMAWPALHRADGTLLVATQSGVSSGDASRDLAGQLLAAAELDPGMPLTAPAPVTGATPRLQDLLDPDTGFDVELHEGFDFWVEGQDLEDDARGALESANASILPTTRMSALRSAYWVRMGERTYLRLVLPGAEDPATNAIARLHGAGEHTIGADTRLLGAFRTCGLLVPVWETDPDRPAADYEDGLAAWGDRYAAALTNDEPLTADQRRARSGLLSRQVTLR